MYIIIRLWKPLRNGYYPPFFLPLEDYEGVVEGWDHEYMIIP